MRKADVPCISCGAVLSLYPRAQAHCLTEECIEGYARHYAMTNVRQEGECEVWNGQLKPGGVAYFAVTVERGGRDKRRDYRALPLRDPRGKGETKNRQYENLCGTKGCVKVDHNRLVVHVPRVKRYIAATLPAQPLLERLERVSVPSGFHGYLSDARKKGTFTVTTADMLCIDILGVHPTAVYGDLFYEV